MFNKFNGTAKIVKKNTTFTYGRKTPEQLKEEQAIKNCNESFAKIGINKKDNSTINKFKGEMFKFKK